MKIVLIEEQLFKNSGFCVPVSLLELRCTNQENSGFCLPVSLLELRCTNQENICLCNSKSKYNRT